MCGPSSNVMLMHLCGGFGKQSPFAPPHPDMCLHALRSLDGHLEEIKRLEQRLKDLDMREHSMQTRDPEEQLRQTTGLMALPGEVLERIVLAAERSLPQLSATCRRLRALVTSAPAFKSQHGILSSVVKLEVPQLLVHVIPLVPLRSGIPTVSVGVMSAFAASRASIKEINDGRLSQPPVYPAVHAQVNP